MMMMMMTGEAKARERGRVDVVGLIEGGERGLKRMGKGKDNERAW
jgi:hypothetical protein